MSRFRLTEQDYGSDLGSVLIPFEDDDDHILLNGPKMWISTCRLRTSLRQTDRQLPMVSILLRASPDLDSET